METDLERLLSESHILKLANSLFSQGRSQELARGDFLYKEGERPHSLYRVKSGLLALLRTSAKGQEHILRLFRPGQILGHRALTTDEPYHAGAKCIDPAVVEVISKPEYFKTLMAHPEMAISLLQVVGKELRRAEIRSIVLTDSDVMSRVASTLLLFKGLYPEHQWTRTEIANYCATRTPTVIKALGKLEDMGIIAQSGRDIKILKAEKLMELSDEL